MDSLIAFKKMFYKLSFILNKREKIIGVLVFMTAFFGSFLELVSVTVILPFIQAIVAPELLMENRYIRIWISFFNIKTNNNLVLFIGVSIILLFLFKNIYILWTSYLQKKYATMIFRSLSTNMLKSYMERPYTFFVNVNSADILRGISGDTDGVYEIIQNTFTMISELVTIMLIGGLLFYSDWMMAMGALGLAAACFFLLVICFRNKMKEAGKKARAANILASKYAYQAVNGIKEITVMQRRDIFVQKYAEAVETYQKMLLTSNFISVCPDRVLEGVCVGGFIGIACIRVMLGIETANFVPTLAVFAMAAFKILPSISKITNKVNMIVYYQPALNEAFENIEIARRFREEQSSYQKNHLTVVNENGIEGFKSKLEIKSVRWKYPNTQNYVLDGCSLTIHKGESVAFIGASGAGKTTLADVIMGLLKPCSGEVLADGIDVFAMPKKWSQTIGYVPQMVYLIDDTIRNNVAFGLNGSDINDELIWKALKQAQILNYVNSLPQGLDTIVGERGVKLSGGQRQRIALARALYYDPDILVLDEATSALDNDTEKAVMEAINTLQRKKTLIIVAHRLSTVKECDKIYELKDGKILERQKEDIFGKENS